MRLLPGAVVAGAGTDAAAGGGAAHSG